MTSDKFTHTRFSERFRLRFSKNFVKIDCYYHIEDEIRIRDRSRFFTRYLRLLVRIVRRALVSFRVSSGTAVNYMLSDANVLLSNGRR